MGNITETKTEGNVLEVVAQVPRIDAAVAKDFKAECEAVWSSAIKAVVIDLGQVDFIDSSGIGALLNVYKRLPPESASVKLINVKPVVQSVIELLRLHRIFELDA